MSDKGFKQVNLRISVELLEKVLELKDKLRITWGEIISFWYEKNKEVR